MILKEQAKKNILAFKLVADMLEIPFCLQAGTLLGAYRDGDFVKGDESDIDIAILEEYYGKIHFLIAGLEHLGFTKKHVFTVENKIESVKLERRENHIDVLCMHVRKNKAFNIGRSFGSHGLPAIFAYTFPAECFKKFGTLKFQGSDFSVPDPVEMYLNAKYANWKNPIPREQYDYLDVKQAPCISRSDWWKSEWKKNYDRYPE
jgi:hypothetical protein